MKIFNGISPNDGYETIQQAATAIWEKATQFRDTPWSLAELQLDKDDVSWLQNWCSQLQYGVALRCLADGQWRTFPVKDGLCSFTTGIGSLLLLTTTEIARRFASERSLWSVISQGHFRETTNGLLFVQHHPSRLYKDAIELAVNELGLRHVFGIEGLQHWYDTVSLQFGFTHKGLLRRLPEWLVEQGQPQAIKHLLSGPMSSGTFQDLWQTLREYRRRLISEAALRSHLANNPWIVTEWMDDLVQQAQMRLNLGYSSNINGHQNGPKSGDDNNGQFLSEPQIRWNPPEPPCFVCSLNPEQLELTMPYYNLIVAEQWCGKLSQRMDGTYNIPAEITIPSISPAIAASLLDPDGQIIQEQTLQLWDENEDVQAFHSPSGKRFDIWKRMMQRESAYVLLLASDLQIDPKPELWHTFRSQMTCYILSPGWSPQTQITLGPDVLWEPYLRDGTQQVSYSTQELKHNLSVQLYDTTGVLHFGDKIRLQITYAADIAIIFVRCGHMRLNFEPMTIQAIITQPLSIEPALFKQQALAHFEIIVGVRYKHQRLICIPLRVQVPITDSTSLTAEGWQALSRTNPINIALIKTQPVKLCVLDADHWMAMEGDMLLESVWLRPKPLSKCTGLGFPLVLQKDGPYNEIEAPRCLLRELIDTGVLTEIVLDDKDILTRSLCLKLSLPIESDAQHCIVWWDTNGTFQYFAPECCEMEDGSMWWLAAVPANLTQPLAIAIAYNGTRLGAIGFPGWWDELQGTSTPALLAAQLRWLRLPIMSTPAMTKIRLWAHHNAVDVLQAWLQDREPHDALDGLQLNISPADEGWLSAIRTIFQDWVPAKEQGIEIVERIMAQHSEEENPIDKLKSVIGPLIRISPLLMGQIIRAWLAGKYPPNSDLQEAKACLGIWIDELVRPNTTNHISLQEKIHILRQQTSDKMEIAPTFLEKALIKPALILFQRNLCTELEKRNIAVAMHREPFRRLLGIEILELIVQMLSER